MKNQVKRCFLGKSQRTGSVLLLVGVLAILAYGAMDGPGDMMGGTAPGTDVALGCGMFGNAQNGNSMTPGWMMGEQGTSGVPSAMPGSTMGGMVNGMTGMMTNGMMSGHMMVNTRNPFYVPPAVLTLAQATHTLNAYLTSLNDANLAFQDLMIFDNHAYAQIVELDSGIGVMEVLIDPETKAVYPEMGPNMMWNQKYGMMSGFGGYGMTNMMMGGSMGTGHGLAELTVTSEQAVVSAQTYLNTHHSQVHLIADAHADPFYGYYTLHVNHDGKTVGMLSVNGFTGQVCPHTWHGELLEMSE
jgi:hypothetical protein